MAELAVVMPVYNEEGSIETVVRKWTNVLNRLEIEYAIFVYNDGSRDNTLQILEEVSKSNAHIVVQIKPNSGHGPTILQGYTDNCKSTWIFQIDSDDEMGPESFDVLWRRRSQYDLLIGRRLGRSSSLPRRTVSLISRITVRLFYGRGVWDVNSPFRLMRSGIFSELYGKIPRNTFAPNVIISGWACRKRLRIFETEILNTDRKTGNVSIKKWKLLKAAVRSFRQTIAFALSSDWRG